MNFIFAFIIIALVILIVQGIIRVELLAKKHSQPRIKWWTEIKEFFHGSYPESFSESWANSTLAQKIWYVVAQMANASWVVYFAMVASKYILSANILGAMQKYPSFFVPFWIAMFIFMFPIWFTTMLLNAYKRPGYGAV